jgi:DNA-binding NarL/FixJ family response regulator
MNDTVELDYFTNLTEKTHSYAFFSKKSKPVMIYFRSPNDDVTKGDSTVVADYNKVLPVDVVVCDGWLELGRLLLERPDQISINSNVFTSTDATTIKETIGMLQTTLKLAKLNIPVALVVENDTYKHVVLEAQRLGLQGLIPYHGDWDPKDIMAGLAALTDRKYHWPEHIINQLPEKSESPNIVYFNNDHSCTPEGINELAEKLACTWSRPADWEELASELKKGHQHLTFHVEMMERMSMTVPEFLQVLETMRQFKNSHAVIVSAIIRKHTPYQTIKQLKKSGIAGIGLDLRDWSVAEVAEGAGYFLRGEAYWPRHIIDQLPGAEKQVVKTKSQVIVLTARQQEVLNLVCRRGLSNKRIAQTLHISESTVKVHISAILKSYGVRNRTQLVLASTTGAW